MPRPALTIVVLVEMFEEVVLLLMFLSCCRVAGRAGDLGTKTGLADFVAVLFVCVVALGLRILALGDVFFVSVRVVRARASSIIALRGLDGFSGEAGRDKYEALVGDVMRGDCLYVRELEDFGERTFDSASRKTCETDRG